MAHRVVGIEIGSDSIRATFAETTFRSFSIVECREVPIPPASEFPSLQLQTLETSGTTAPESPVAIQELPKDPTDKSDPDQEDIDEEDSDKEKIEPVPDFVFGLVSFLKSPGVHFDEAAITIPSHYVSNHIIELPFSDAKKIDQIISLEIENFVPFDIEEMVLGYQMVEKTEAGSKVLVSLVKKADMAKFLEHLAMAGLDPAIIDIGPNALSNAFRLSNPEPEQEAIILHVGQDRSDLTLLMGAVIIGVRSLPVGMTHIDFEDPDKGLLPLSRKLIQTIQGMRLKHGLSLDTILISGPLASNPVAAEKLSEEIGVAINLFEPFRAEFEKTVADDDKTNALFAKSLGIALRHTVAANKGQINLRQGSFAYKHAGGFFKQELKRIAIMGAVLFVLLSYNLIYNHLQNKEESEAIRQQIIKVFSETFPGERVVNPVEQFKSNMEQVYKKYRLVGNLGDGDLKALDILRHISESIPKTIKVDIKKLDIQQDRVSMEGVTSNFEMVDKIETALRTFKGFKEIKKDTATKTANEAIKFKFSIKISEKVESSVTGRRSLLKGGG